MYAYTAAGKYGTIEQSTKQRGCFAGSVQKNRIVRAQKDGKQENCKSTGAGGAAERRAFRRRDRRPRLRGPGDLSHEGVCGRAGGVRQRQHYAYRGRFGTGGDQASLPDGPGADGGAGPKRGLLPPGQPRHRRVQRLFWSEKLRPPGGRFCGRRAGQCDAHL